MANTRLETKHRNSREITSKFRIWCSRAIIPRLPGNGRPKNSSYSQVTRNKKKAMCNKNIRFSKQVRGQVTDLQVGEDFVNKPCVHGQFIEPLF